jgi:hypothetical protein
MEAAMYRSLAAIAAALTLLSGALLVSDRAEAGASASAPSKHSRLNQTTTQQAQNHRQRNDFGITEYSSSSARNRSQQH